MVLQHIRVIPLADESLGVRSMCTYVETPDVKILLDAGVSLCPRREGLPPHVEEFKAVRDARKKIIGYARKADVITVSHYHFDHFTPGFASHYEWTSEDTYVEIYSNKILLIKDPVNNINFNQKKRAHVFTKLVKDIVSELKVADGVQMEFGKTVVKFSPPLPHGPDDTKLGYVLVISVEYDGVEKLVFAPDVQGPISDKSYSYIASEVPDLLILGGPPTYLRGRKLSEDNLAKALDNLSRLALLSRITVVSHHMLRDCEWKRYLEDLFKKAEKHRRRIVTAAEFLGEENRFLEANRKKLFEENPPSEEFMKWINLSKEEKAKVAPPI